MLIFFDRSYGNTSLKASFNKITMDNIQNISIPQACHQAWQQMNVVNEGRHCEHCCKTVVDFTTMTNNEIIAYLSTKNNVNHWLYVKDLSARNWWKRIVLVVGILGSLPLFKANGRPRPTIVSTAIDTTGGKNRPQSDNYTLGKVGVVPDSLRQGTIKGKVTGSDDGLPIVGAMIKLKSTNITTQTNLVGDFTINVSNSTDTLVVSYIG